MKNNRTTALLMLLVFLVVVAVVIIFLTGLDRDSSRRNDNFENVTNTAILETPVVTPIMPPLPQLPQRRHVRSRLRLLLPRPPRPQRRHPARHRSRTKTAW